MYTPNHRLASQKPDSGSSNMEPQVWVAASGTRRINSERGSRVDLKQTSRVEALFLGHVSFGHVSCSIQLASLLRRTSIEPLGGCIWGPWRALQVIQFLGPERADVCCRLPFLSFSLPEQDTNFCFPLTVGKQGC